MLVLSNGPLATGPAWRGQRWDSGDSGPRQGKGGEQDEEGAITPGCPRRARLLLPGPAALLGGAAGGSSEPAAPGSGRARSPSPSGGVGCAGGMEHSAAMSHLKLTQERGVWPRETLDPWMC